MSEITYNQRGFAVSEPIVCSYGSKVKVHESSAASGPHIWLNVKCDPKILRDQDSGDGTAHLTLLQAIELRERLDEQIEHAKRSWEPETIERALAGVDPNSWDED